jgi:hypothetical protein
MFETLLKTAEAWNRKLRKVVGALRARPPEVVSLLLTVVLLCAAGNWVAAKVKAWTDTRHGVEILSGVCYLGVIVLIGYAVIRVWKQVRPPRLEPEAGALPTKGLMPFTPGDGPLFRRLGREQELSNLLSYILDDQVALVVLMGGLRVGKNFASTGRAVARTKGKGTRLPLLGSTPDQAGGRPPPHPLPDLDDYAKRIADTPGARETLQTIPRHIGTRRRKELPQDVQAAYTLLDREASGAHSVFKFQGSCLALEVNYG